MTGMDREPRDPEAAEMWREVQDFLRLRHVMRTYGMTLWEFSETPEELVEMLIKADMTQAAIDERNRTPAGPDLPGGRARTR